jgi:hypothetical protein
MANEQANSAISIFNIGQHTEEMNAAMQYQKKENNLFDPKLEKVTDTLLIIVRPIPYYKNPLESKVEKNFYALEDGAGTVIFDSRTTFNKPAENHYEFCPVSDLWSKLHFSTDLNVQERSKALRLQRANYSYMQIVNFPSKPEMNGQIVVMKLPMEMVKLFNSMMSPSKDELALGTKPVQPYDMFHGSDLKCTITGKMVNGILMRDWKVEQSKRDCEVNLPLGPNGAMLPISKCKQEDVLKFFEDVETVDIAAQYGYHEPSYDVKRRVKAILKNIAAGIPGLEQVAANYFPEVDEGAHLDQNAQPAQPAPQPLSQPTPQPVVAGNPMAVPETAQVAKPGAPVTPAANGAPAIP